MVKSDDPRYRTPRLILGWSFIVLGAPQLVLRLWGGPESPGFWSGVILGIGQLTVGLVVVILAWRLPKIPRDGAVTSDAAEQ